jgi:glycosyltransferase involved in cell wall biosynthesis
MQTQISVAMGTYNGEEHIIEQLDSLAKQTVLPCELVVCDDCSKDKTVNILRYFAASAPFQVRIYVNESNLGFSDNFLKAASLCKGDWIAFCDQDDVWLPIKLARACEMIELYSGLELVLVGHTSLVAKPNLELTGQRSPDYQQDKYMKRASNFAFWGIQGFSMIFRAALL